MSRKIALLFAGQGAQSVGMARDLAEKYPVADALIRRSDEILGRSLSSIMFDGPPEVLTRTGNCQPALFVHGLACLAVLRELVGDFSFAAAGGLSLGEFTAHTAAGTFDFETGLRLVESRGQFMDEACDTTNGGMAAMIGAEEGPARDLAAQANVDVANLNCPGQIVLSGEMSGIALAIGLAKEFGIRRATQLNVAGAYHSRLMQSAYEKLGEKLAAAEISTPKVPVVCNVDGVVVGDPSDIRRTLSDQVTGTVLWTACMETLLDTVGCDLFIELGPGGILAGLMGRTRKGVEVLAASNCATVGETAAKLKEYGV